MVLCFRWENSQVGGCPERSSFDVGKLFFLPGVVPLFWRSSSSRFRPSHVRSRQMATAPRLGEVLGGRRSKASFRLLDHGRHGTASGHEAPIGRRRGSFKEAESFRVDVYICVYIHIQRTAHIWSMVGFHKTDRPVPCSPMSERDRSEKNVQPYGDPQMRLRAVVLFPVQTRISVRTQVYMERMYLPDTNTLDPKRYQGDGYPIKCRLFTGKITL